MRDAPLPPPLHQSLLQLLKVRASLWLDILQAFFKVKDRLKVLRVKKGSGYSFSRHCRAYTEWYIIKKGKEAYKWKSEEQEEEDMWGDRIKGRAHLSRNARTHSRGGRGGDPMHSTLQYKQETNKHITGENGDFWIKKTLVKTIEPIPK